MKKEVLQRQDRKNKGMNALYTQLAFASMRLEKQLQAEQYAFNLLSLLAEQIKRLPKVQLLAVRLAILESARLNCSKKILYEYMLELIDKQLKHSTC